LVVPVTTRLFIRYLYILIFGGFGAKTFHLLVIFEWVSLDEYEYEKVRQLLLDTVNGYAPQHEIRDLMFLKDRENKSALHHH
jgi:hypothetical protein